MKINRKELLKALQAVKPGVATNETIEQSASFVFNDNRVFSYNDEISVSVPLKLDLTGSVPAKEFLALINKMSAEEVTLTVNGNEIQVVGGKSKAGLRLESEIKLPLEEIGMPEGWNELPAKFCEGVQFCLFSAGKDQTKYILTHIHVSQDCVESSDGYRATRYYMHEDQAFSTPLLIPTVAAKDVVAYTPHEYATTDGWLHFRNKDDMVFSCRCADETYPNIDIFIEAKGESIQLPEGLDAIMDRGSVLSEGQRLTIILEDGGNLVLATENDAGWFEEETKVAYKGKPLEFDIYPEFLTKILKVKAEVTVSEKLMKFETDDFTHVVALLTTKKK